MQHDNLAGRVVQPVEGDGRTNAGSGKQAKKIKKKPTVPVVTDEQQAHDGRAEGEVQQEELLEKKTTKEKVHIVLQCLDDGRCMRLQEDLSLQRHHDQL